MEKKKKSKGMTSLLKAISKTTTDHLGLGVYYCTFDGENKAYQNSVYTVQAVDLRLELHSSGESICICILSLL